MGAAIPVMHYTGMAAASFTPSASAMAQWNRAYAVSAGSLSAAAVSVVTFVILGLAVVTSLADRRFAAQGVELEGEVVAIARSWNPPLTRLLESIQVGQSSRLERTGGSHFWVVPLRGDRTKKLSR